MGAAGVAGVGSFIQAGGALQAGNARAGELDQEADVQFQNAELARAAGAKNAERQQIQAGMKIGAIKSDYAASGVSADSGSVLDILRQSHTNAELDRQNILHGADVQFINYRNRASAALEGARNAQTAGKMNAFAAIFGGAASAMSMGAGASAAGGGGGYVDTSSSGSSYGSAGGSNTDFSNYS